MTEKKSDRQELEEILERVGEGTTTVADAEALRRLFALYFAIPARGILHADEAMTKSVLKANDTRYTKFAKKRKV